MEGRLISYSYHSLPNFVHTACPRLFPNKHHPLVLGPARFFLKLSFFLDHLVIISPLSTTAMPTLHRFPEATTKLPLIHSFLILTDLVTPYHNNTVRMYITTMVAYGPFATEQDIHLMQA